MALLPYFPTGFRLFPGEALNALVGIFNGLVPLPGGLNATGRFRYTTVPVGSVAYGSFGNATTTVAGTVYVADTAIPRNFTITGVGILNGGTVGTDKGIVSIYSSTGAVLGTSALAGATTAGANAFQQYALTSPIKVTGPNEYFVGYQSNGTTDNIRTVAASTFPDVLTQSATGAFGTIPAITPPTTFTANVGPVAYIY